MLMHFFLFRLLPHVTSTPPWLLRPMKISTTPTLDLFLFFECICIQFFNSLTCDLRDTMPCQRSLTLTHTHSYLGKQRIFLGVTINLGICLCPHTQIDCNRFTIILALHLYMSILEKLLLVVKTLIKNGAAATLNQQSKILK